MSAIDFLMVSTRATKKGTIEIYPNFKLMKSKDLMIRGGDFYAIWVEEKGLWSTDEQDVIRLVDIELDKYAEENKARFECGYRVLHMWNSETGMIDRWHKYCQRQMRDSFHMLDERLIFANMTTTKKDYASKKLPYPLEEKEAPSWNRLMEVLYTPEERHKIEWAIGSIVSGDSRKLQKFMVFYGAAGTGKSTVIHIIEQLFEGYTGVFHSKALGSSSNSFALEDFRDNPLVAIEHDGNLSKIEDNSRLNSLVSHEKMTVNEKFKSSYVNNFKCFLFMGTNEPVKITNAKSGLIRRLIDVSPTGNKLSLKEYKNIMDKIGFELGAIAHLCQEVYLNDPDAYENYIPLSMLGASNDFYNFMEDSWSIFNREDETTLKAAWEMYKVYCEDAKVNYPYSQRAFKEELKNYFFDYKDRDTLPDGTRVRSHYIGFRKDRFTESERTECDTASSQNTMISFHEQKSIFDKICSDCPAQYASDAETPIAKWVNVTTKLSELDTSRIHYVKVPDNHIVIDFDLTDGNGEKSYVRNLEEASKWPQTYAELSKSGKGIHLHYIYDGDATQLSRVYADHIEVKVFTGGSSLRRKLTKCNELPIAHISHGLPIKEAKDTVNFDAIKSENALRTLIRKNLKKEIVPYTKPSIDFIYNDLKKAKESGLKYDVSDMRPQILAFAASSTNQAEACIKLVNRMEFMSEERSEPISNDDQKLIFYDVEVFPNLFLVNWKIEGEGKPVVRLINPTPAQIEELMQYRLVGFNCRRYDNHILYARWLGYSNEELYRRSMKIINGDKDCFFGEAYNISYTDVLDFSTKKQSLKKFEIELGIHHQELGLPWDQPVPEEMWTKVAEYCDNDVIATEAVFNARKEDFLARQILADLAGMTVNDTSNSLTTRIIFGNNRHPQDQFNYRFMGNFDKPQKTLNFPPIDLNCDLEYTILDDDDRPIFPGYTFERGKSMYREEEVGEGGYVYAEPGMHGNVALLDIASMHPSSIVAENLFGTEYTKRFQELLNARLYIKHGELDKAGELFDGKLQKYLKDESMVKMLDKSLKIPINSVYGLTSASFENAFHDPRNKDNIVAKRGALFMINLKHEVQRLGYTVAHIKTDSIKIPDADAKIIDFVMKYGKLYGYTFEHEATYDKMCLVNDAVYIAKYKTVDQCERAYGKEYVHASRDTLKDCKKHPGEWTATGTQFQVPYVFKTLFSRDDILFQDMCEAKSVSTAIYLDLNEELPDVTKLEQELYVITKGDREHERQEELKKIIADAHNYKFIGKVGLFCPVLPGNGGGLLMREVTNKNTGAISYAAVTGSKGYRWLESEMVKKAGMENCIDRSYYNGMVNDAVSAISKYCDFEWFAGEDTYDVPPDG